MSLRKTGRIVIGLLIVFAAVTAGFIAFEWRPALDPINPPPVSSFDAALVRRGARLAAIGDCATCHTARGGKPYAGGLPLPTPFGTIYAPNITPDPDTGIGYWSQRAFIRAMRAGVDRTGHHLYPAFPYDHFTLVTDEDNEALYAFLMTRQPVRARAPPNQLRFPLNYRPLVAGWKLLFFRQGPYRPASAHDETWNRGAYLAEGLGHCGACHTPRNLLGAEQRNRHFDGGEAEGWHAYAINASSQAPVPWDVGALGAFLHEGWHEFHGVARGPMAPVTDNLASVPDADITSMATYVASVMGTPTPDRLRRAAALAASAAVTGPGARPQSAGSQTAPSGTMPPPNDVGAAIYVSACASCHESGRPVPFGGIKLDLSIGVSGESPVNIIRVVLEGLAATDAERKPVMPGFSDALSDHQLASLLTYLRTRFSRKPVWSDLERAIREVRGTERDTSIQSAAAAGAP
jgi:mono/diheme cytochrome c family protein